MERFTDKACVTLMAAACLFAEGNLSTADIVALLCAVIATSVLDTLGTVKRQRLLVAAGLATCATLTDSWLCVLPLVSYDLTGALGPRGVLVCAVPLVLGMLHGFKPVPFAAVSVAIVAAGLLSVRTSSALAASDHLHRMRDDLQEKVYDLEASQRELTDAQDQLAQAATLAERTRIAREVHDGVGHVLTRAKLQVEALRIVHATDGVNEELGQVSTSLDEALHAMRASVHALEDRGSDVGQELRRLGDASGIASVRVDCTTDAEPPAAITQCVVGVCREALTNAARHAHAAHATVRFTEHPGLWQLFVSNDGTMPASMREGMGVRTMRQRVESCGGTLTVSWDRQFCVFASIPKGHEAR